MKDIHVVGAAIHHNSLILAVQRSESMSLPLKWEFPGGKIEAGETKEQALIREIKEELCIEITNLEFVSTATYEYDFGRVHLSVFKADIAHGELVLKEHADKKWLAPNELLNLDWAPVDIPAAEILAT